MRPNDRSFKGIRTQDLARLADIARADRNDLFRRKPDLAAVYADRLLCVALCQGAALHYLDGRNGVKDFDVWSFFKANPRRAFPARRNMHRDFGDRRFGVSPDRPEFVGRSVDLIGRSIPFRPGQTAVEAVRDYLRVSRATSARWLSQKAVVFLEPQDEIGRVIWPLSKSGAG